MATTNQGVIQGLHDRLPAAWPALALAASAAMLATAHAFERLGGYAPCLLCLKQREVYWVAGGIALAGLVLLRTRAGDAGHYVVAHLASPRTVAASVTEQAKDAVTPAVDAVRTRIEPAVEQLRGVPAQVGASIPASVQGVPTKVAAAIPESVRTVPSTVGAAVGSGVDRVRSLRG